MIAKTMPGKASRWVGNNWEVPRDPSLPARGARAGPGSSLWLQPLGALARSWRQAEIDGEQAPAMRSIKRLPTVLAAEREEGG